MFRKKMTEQPLYYWEDKSYMMIIPNSYSDNILKKGIDKLSKSKEFELKDTTYGMDGSINLKIVYDDIEYEVGLFVGGISVPAYYLEKNFLFNDQERQKILSATKAITIYMPLKDNPKKSYHLELKLCVALCPDLIGVMDESAEKMLPAKWVVMSANSKVEPSSKDLFNVQAVTDEFGEVWLHTHGLCRCGLRELEIIESNQDVVQHHYNLIVAYAMYLIDRKVGEDFSYLSCFIGSLIDGSPIVVTSVSWTVGLNEYKKAKIGNIKDRKNAHNTKSNIIFLYTSEEEEKKHILKKVSIYNHLWSQNPLFFFSDEETDRMRKLAHERFSFVKEALKNKDNQVLLKIGLPLQEENKFEHIWFELLEIKGKKFKAKLTQEPYDIPNMHTGDEAWYTLDDVTDWIIYTKTAAINPSNVYLLEN